MEATTELQRYIARAYSEGKKKHADGTEACRWRCSNSYQRQPQTSYRSLQFMSWIKHTEQPDALIGIQYY